MNNSKSIYNTNTASNDDCLSDTFKVDSYETKNHSSDNDKDTSSLANNTSVYSKNYTFTSPSVLKNEISAKPTVYFVPFNQMSLSERMKIKKEKAKKLLEKKVKRDNIDNNIHSTINSNLDLEDFINNTSNDLNDFDDLKGINIQNLSKKEIKMLRNRIAAQRSRDRKKKEFDDIKIISHNLMEENSFLKKTLKNKDNEIQHLRNQLANLCNNCNEKVHNKNSHSQTQLRLNESDFSSTNSSRSSSILKIPLMFGFLAIFCIIGIFSNILTFNETQPTAKRILNKVETNAKKEQTNSKTVVTPSTSTTGLILYNNSDTNKPPNNNSNNKVFNIKKDYNNKLNKELDLISKQREQSNDQKLINNNKEKATLNLNNKIINDESTKNMIVPLNNAKKYIEKEILTRSLKSIYCRDILSNVDDNIEIIKNLFINKTENKFLGENIDSDDRVILHMDEDIEAISEGKGNFLLIYYF
jgi:hypothetical protein